ncbi:MAG: DNA repair protein RecO [Arenicellales bacterium]|nr:DNA repair protein RecO [Arenicellales bacterium]
MRVSREAAYTLHSRPYRESSLLIDAFTREYGRVTVLAKGIRKLKSRQRSAMLPFSLLSIGWSGKGELPVLTQAEHDGPVTVLRGQRRLCGFYVNELLVKLLHKHDPHAELFDAYHGLLDILVGGVDMEMHLRLFEKRLLQELGYALELEHESDGSTRIDPQAIYQYVPMYGAVRVGRTTSNILTVQGATLLALAREKLDRTDLDESKQLMRSVISHYLGQHRINARSLFRTYTDSQVHHEAD